MLAGVVDDQLPGAILGGVVYEHNPVVGVVLLQDGVDVVDVPVVLGVVVAGDDDAEGQLRVLRYVVLLLVVLALLCGKL